LKRLKASSLVPNTSYVTAQPVSVWNLVTQSTVGSVEPFST